VDCRATLRLFASSREHKSPLFVAFKIHLLNMECGHPEGVLESLADGHPFGGLHF